MLLYTDLLLIIKVCVKICKKIIQSSDLGGFKIYSTVAQLGLTSATVTDLKQVVNAMPDMSRLCCSADGQFPNIVFPTSYGTLEIIRININRVSLKYYVSIPDAIGKTYTGSYHSNSDFSGWFNFLTNADFGIVRVEIAVSTANFRTEITQMSARGRYWIPVVDGHSTAIVSRPVVTFDGGKWYIFADIAQTYFVSFYMYPVTL